MQIAINEDRLHISLLIKARHQIGQRKDICVIKKTFAAFVISCTRASHSGHRKNKRSRGSPYISPVFSRKRDRRPPGSVNTRRRTVGRWSRIRRGQVADRRPQVGRKEDIRTLMPRRDDGGVNGDRSYGFVVVPCVRRNFPQRRRLSVRGDATRRDATRRDAPRTASHRHTCTYHVRLRHCSDSPSSSRPSFSHTKSNIPALPPSGYNAILAQARRHLQVARSLGRLDALHRDV